MVSVHVAIAQAPPRAADRHSAPRCPPTCQWQFTPFLLFLRHKFPRDAFPAPSLFSFRGGHIHAQNGRHLTLRAQPRSRPSGSTPQEVLDVAITDCITAIAAFGEKFQEEVERVKRSDGETMQDAVY